MAGGRAFRYSPRPKNLFGYCVSSVFLPSALPTQASIGFGAAGYHSNPCRKPNPYCLRRLMQYYLAAGSIH